MHGNFNFWLRKKKFVQLKALWTVDDSEFKLGHEKIGTFANVKIMFDLRLRNQMKTNLLSSSAIFF